MMLPLAHSAHWIADLVFIAPLIGVGVWLAVAAIRDRRHRSQ